MKPSNEVANSREKLQIFGEVMMAKNIAKPVIASYEMELVPR